MSQSLRLISIMNIWMHTYIYFPVTCNGRQNIALSNKYENVIKIIREYQIKTKSCIKLLQML